MLLNETSGGLILDVPPSEEASQLTMPGQVVVKTLTTGEIEVGLSRNRLARFGYSPGGVIVCRSNAEEWVRWRNPMSTQGVAGIQTRKCLLLFLDCTGPPKDGCLHAIQAI